MRSFLQELREHGYLETHGSGPATRVYRLSDKAYLNPETDRLKPNDTVTEDLISAMIGTIKDGGKRRLGGRRRKKKPDRGAVSINNTDRKKRKIAGDDDKPPLKKIKRSSVVSTDRPEKLAIGESNKCYLRGNLEVYTGIPTESLREGRNWPKGWIEVSLRQLAGVDAGRIERCWISPKTRFRLISMPEVEFFLKILSENGGKEILAVRKIVPDRRALAIGKGCIGGLSGTIEIYSGLPTKSPGQGLEWPEGWIETNRMRLGGAHFGRIDFYWLSPKTHFKLDSITNVRRFLKILGQKGVDEQLASRRFRAMKKKLPPASPPTLAVLQNRDLMGEIVEYLDTETILFVVPVIAKVIGPHISYEHALRCAMNKGKGKRRVQQITNLIQKGCIYPPSPMRILRLSAGRRCEVCNRTRTCDVNDMGLFFCRSCTLERVAEVKLKGESAKTKFLIRATMDEESCAKIVTETKKMLRYFMYDGKTPFVDRAGEKAGPIVSLTDLKAGVRTKLFESASADDTRRHPTQQILEACEKILLSKAKIYNHLGINDHAGPFWGTAQSMWKVLVQWENGERTWQPLTQFGMDDPESCAMYASDRGLLDTKGWRRFRKSL